MTLNYNHKEPCDCVNCDGVRLAGYHGPGMYRAKGKGTTTWKLGIFLWDIKLEPGALFYVMRELDKSEKGGHLDGVVGVIVDEDGENWVKGPMTCTSKKWFEPA